jgi:hypothetical protein
MTLAVDQRNAAFIAVKAKLIAIINDEAGMFSSEIEGSMTDADILAVSDAALNAAFPSTPQTP